MKTEYSYNKVVSVRDVYGAEYSELETEVSNLNLEIADFSPPKRGELYRPMFAEGAIAATVNFSADAPRLILRKRKKKFLIGEWEVVGDNVVPATGQISSSMADYYSVEYKYYRIEEREAWVSYPSMLERLHKRDRALLKKVQRFEELYYLHCEEGMPRPIRDRVRQRLLSIRQDVERRA